MSTVIEGLHNYLLIICHLWHFHTTLFTLNYIRVIPIYRFYEYSGPCPHIGSRDYTNMDMNLKKNIGQ